MRTCATSCLVRFLDSHALCHRGVEGSQKMEMRSNESGTNFLLHWGRGSDLEGRGRKSSAFDA